MTNSSDSQNGQKSSEISASPEQKNEGSDAIPVTELERLQKDASEYKDKYLRLLAESENARKRLQKERQELTQYALQGMIVDFLNPIDHFENALKFAEDSPSSEVKHWAKGFEMILDQFKDVLAKNNVFTFESEGKHFDPHFHEAIDTIITAEAKPGTVLSESMKGYRLGDKTIIRPARVKVAKAPSAPQADAEKDSNDKTEGE